MSVLSRTIYAKVRIIIVYTIKTTLKCLCLRHFNTKKNPDTVAGVGIYVYRKGRAPYPIVLKRLLNEYLLNLAISRANDVQTLLELSNLYAVNSEELCLAVSNLSVDCADAVDNRLYNLESSVVSARRSI